MRNPVAATLLASVVLLGGLAAMAAEKASVTALLKQGYQIVGVIPSTVGPGIFLRKGDVLIACFVAETPNSQEIATQYCKPVR